MTVSPVLLCVFVSLASLLVKFFFFYLTPLDNIPTGPERVAEKMQKIRRCLQLIPLLPMFVIELLYCLYLRHFFYPVPPHMSFTDFVVFPPGHDRSVTDF